MAEDSLSSLRAYIGGCHCGAVRFEVTAPEVLQVVECK